MNREWFLIPKPEGSFEQGLNKITLNWLLSV